MVDAYSLRVVNELRISILHNLESSWCERGDREDNFPSLGVCPRRIDRRPESLIFITQPPSYSGVLVSRRQREKASVRLRSCEPLALAIDFVSAA
jgi:hypothetical protein